MRSLSPFILLFLLFLFSNNLAGDARKDPEDYWKSIMKGESMPKAIEELVVHGGDDDNDGQEEAKKMGHYFFNRNFDTKPNAIIYHSHHKTDDREKAKKMGHYFFNRNFDTKPNAIIYHSHHKTDHHQAAEGHKSLVKTAVKLENIVRA